MVAEARITDMNFPLVLPGEIVAGTITLTNVGDEPTGVEAGFFGVLVTTLWDGVEHTLFTYSITAPGETLNFDFHLGMGGIGTLPEGVVKAVVVGRTWLNENWRVDDEKIISLGEPEVEGISWKPLAGVGAAAAIFFKKVFKGKK